MLKKDQLQAIKAPFPPEALSSDTSRGFELTSIRAAFVIERLNEVFGPCGIGWRYVHAPFEVLDTGNGRREIVTEVALQYRFVPTSDYVGTGPVDWSAGWVIRTSEISTAWSEPILACGGKSIGKGGAAFTDARKSAVTDGLTKAASMIGVGHQVFKGLVRPGKTRGNGADSTAFWALYRKEAKKAGVSLDVAKGLANKGNWTAACTELRTATQVRTLSPRLQEAHDRFIHQSHVGLLERNKLTLPTHTAPTTSLTAEHATGFRSPCVPDTSPICAGHNE